MFGFLKRRKKKVEIHPNRVDDEDAMMREVVSKCFNEGKAVVGNQRGDGTFEVYSLKNEKND
jgi:hypothetical protein